MSKRLSERQAERSPERQALADAIAARAAAETILKPQRDALARIEEDLFKARRDEEEAELAVARAARLDARALADAYVESGNPVAAAMASAVALAEANLAKARSRTRELESIATTLEARRAEGLYPVENQDVRAAVRLVVMTSPEVARLVEDFQIAKRTYTSMFSTLRWLAFEGMIPGHLKEIAPRGHDVFTHPPDPAWETAIAQLASDPDASLP